MVELIQSKISDLTTEIGAIDKKVKKLGAKILSDGFNDKDNQSLSKLMAERREREFAVGQLQALLDGEEKPQE